jgi:hypothetical protein
MLRAIALCLALVATGCVTSKAPLLGPDSRVLPFLPSTQFETYERDDARSPWKKGDGLMTLSVDQGLVITELNADGKRKDEATNTIHPLGSDRFLIQGRYKPDSAYSYAVLDIRNGEGILTGLICKSLDQAAFRRDGGKVTADACELDGAPDPLALLKKLAAKPTGPQMRYVPIRK